MGYERNDRGYGANDRGYGADRGQGYNQDQGRGDNRARGQGEYGPTRDYRGDNSDYARRPLRNDDQQRGMMDRAGDEVRSWFGDEDAERRRRADERNDYRDDGRGRSEYQGRDDQGRGASSYGRSGAPDRQAHPDTHYHSWRDRQMSSFDQDYDEYRREHQSRFESEFATWRQQRQGKRELLGKVQEHQEVVGSDGQHIGTVDHVRGDRIRLTKTDKDAGGHHHSIPSSWIETVDDKVTVSKTADQAKQHWRDEQRNDEQQRNEGGLFGGRDDDRGGTNLNRSFSGTY